MQALLFVDKPLWSKAPERTDQSGQKKCRVHRSAECTEDLEKCKAQSGRGPEWAELGPEWAIAVRSAQEDLEKCKALERTDLSGQPSVCA